MDNLEKVERLREKADVSYEEAKKALDECDGDLLDAMVYLEKQGKVKRKGRAVIQPSMRSRKISTGKQKKKNIREGQRIH